MEKIKFVYEFSDESFDSDKKKIVCERALEDGLHDYDVCEMFIDFMNSVGFSENNVLKYFQE